MSLQDKAAARRERIAKQATREGKQLRRDPGRSRDEVPVFKIGKVRIQTTNRQSVDERGKTTRTPPERTER